jgi:catechol 2,3-dioxygenase-like lactoylglutathione lyase family enzyme
VTQATRQEDNVAVQDVAVVSVPVSDPERAKAFYVETLGFDLVRDDDSVPGIRWIQVSPRGGGTSLTLVTWFDSMPAGSLRGLVLKSNDLQGDYQALVARGVEFDAPPQARPWGSEETVLYDPDGNALVLQG